MKLLKITQLTALCFTLMACSGEEEVAKVESLDAEPAVELQAAEEFNEQENSSQSVEEQQFTSEETEERQREYIEVLETEIEEIEDVRRRNEEEAARNGTPLQLVRPSQEARFQEKKQELEALKQKLEE